MSDLMGFLWFVAAVLLFFGRKWELGMLSAIIGLLFWILGELEKLRRSK